MRFYFGLSDFLFCFLGTCKLFSRFSMGIFIPIGLQLWEIYFLKTAALSVVDVGTLDLSILSLNTCFRLYFHSMHFQFHLLTH